ncbi:FAD synthase [Mycoplasmopsis agalactiae]|uniref:FAD synthase n=1 Tax=Mycoplasmopsis agalactiae TaxID=2110 RepID=UPI0014560188|nr:hypothetical protein [Mycoplasmopsis agalactiae]MCE6057009.1 hypothetical protein [Mycoplasmopsis agalactiae]MCE6078796.1 hypothetical protein [Mycoplasmopsis agalactiae]MCE6095179.1 hypothetical protein [Mycoplasmopsis agalactiae]NLS34269.1 hypothetical protein [Mycoplasmopsis agalactiae]
MSFNVYSFNNLPKFNDPIYLIGVFESFHLGHNFLYEKAKEIKGNSNRDIVIVFFRDIENMFKNKNGYIFTDFENRIQEFANLGFAQGIYLEFEKLWALEANLFLEKLFKNQDGLIDVVVGKDFRFGLNAKGNLDTIKETIGEKNVHSVDIVKIGENIKVSTTFLKSCIEIGDIELVNSLNLYTYSFSAYITFNDITKSIKLTTDSNIIPLKDGIYLSYVEINEMTYYAVLKANIDNYEIKFLDFELKDNVANLKSRIKILKSLRFISLLEDDMILNSDIVNAKKILLNDSNNGKI